MTTAESPPMIWIKSTACGASYACVELAAADGMIALRDSKDPEVLLYYWPAEVRAFFDGVKRGEFDHLIPPEPVD